MALLFSSGHIVDAVLVLVAVEAVVLTLWFRRDGSPLPLLCNLASGAALMLALRAALTGADWTVVALCLAAAGLAHGTEMTLRLRAVPEPAGPRRETPSTRTLMPD